MQGKYMPLLVFHAELLSKCPWIHLLHLHLEYIPPTESARTVLYKVKQKSKNKGIGLLYANNGNKNKKTRALHANKDGHALYSRCLQRVTFRKKHSDDSAQNSCRIYNFHIFREKYKINSKATQGKFLTFNIAISREPVN